MQSRNARSTFDRRGGKPAMQYFTLILALTAVAACSSGAATTNRNVLVDDAQAGQTMDHFRYTGQWEHITARDDGRFDGTSSRSRHMGDTAVLPFEGSVVRLYGVRGPNGGKAGIAIDDHYYGTVDFFSTTKEAHAVVFQSPSLPQGAHAIGIIVRDNTTTPHRAYVNIDGAEVLPAQ